MITKGVNKVKEKTKKKSKQDIIKEKLDYDMDFRGKRAKRIWKVGDNKIMPNREHMMVDYIDSEYFYQMQPRKVRLKSFFYLCLYLTWYSSVILFLMYRMGGNDLDEMEKEAMERLKKIEQSKKI